MTTQTKALAPIDAFRADLAKMQPEFVSALPKHVPSDKFIRAAKTLVQMRPELLSSDVDRRSVYGELMKCAQDGLIPDGREATVNVYKGVAKYIPMVYGLCKKARNSGEIKTIDALVVYEKDFYEAWTDETGAHFKHKKALGERGKPILTYAYAITKDGGFFIEEIDETGMAAIEKSSPAAGKGFSPWAGPFKDEMRRKSAIRRLSKYRLPSSADLDELMERDADLFNAPEPAPEKPAEPSTKPSRLGKIIEAKAESVEPAPAAEAPADKSEEVPI